MSIQATTNTQTAVSSVDDNRVSVVEPPEESTVSASPFDSMEGEKALEAIKPFLHLIPSDDIRRLAMSAQILVRVGLCYARLYEEDRYFFEKHFSKEIFDAAELANIGYRVKGFWHADIMLRRVMETQGPLEALLEEATPLRSKLIKAAVYLWSEHPSLGEVVADIRSGHGHVNKADDLRSMAALFADHWGEVANRCDVTEEDVLRADELGARILEIMGSANSAEVSDLKKLRDASSEYVRRGIEEIRAAASFAFRKDKDRLNRYPTFALGKKKSINGKEEDDVEAIDEISDETEVLMAQTDSAVSENADLQPSA